MPQSKRRNKGRQRNPNSQSRPKKNSNSSSPSNFHSLNGQKSSHHWARNNNSDTRDPHPSRDKISQYKRDLHSRDIDRQLHAVSQLRVLLSDETQPPIDAVIKANCVPRLIEILKTRGHNTLLFETAWVLTNICSGSHEHTMAVVENGGIECILDLFNIDDNSVLEQAIWVLGNIAGDGTVARDICLSKGVLHRLISLADKHKTLPLSFQRNYVWTISNLVRGKPQFSRKEQHSSNRSELLLYRPEWDSVSAVIPVVLEHLQSDDVEVLTDTCWALSYLSDGSNEHIQTILDCSRTIGIDVADHLVSFLDRKEMNVLVPALRTCGNVVSGSDEQTQTIIEKKLLTKLNRLLRHHNHSVKKEAIWTVSNITAGNPDQIQLVIDAGLIEPLVDILRDPTADHDLVKECIWAISNATTGGTQPQLAYLAKHASVGLAEVMSHFPHDKKLKIVLLEGLENLLSFADSHVLFPLLPTDNDISSPHPHPQPDKSIPPNDHLPHTLARAVTTTSTTATTTTVTTGQPSHNGHYSSSPMSQSPISMPTQQYDLAQGPSAKRMAGMSRMTNIQTRTSSTPQQQPSSSSPNYASQTRTTPASSSPKPRARESPPATHHHNHTHQHSHSHSHSHNHSSTDTDENRNEHDCCCCGHPFVLQNEVASVDSSNGTCENKEWIYQPSQQSPPHPPTRVLSPTQSQTPSKPQTPSQTQQQKMSLREGFKRPTTAEIEWKEREEVKSCAVDTEPGPFVVSSLVNSAAANAVQLKQESFKFIPPKERPPTPPLPLNGESDIEIDTMYSNGKTPKVKSKEKQSQKSKTKKRNKRKLNNSNSNASLINTNLLSSPPSSPPPSKMVYKNGDTPTKLQKTALKDLSIAAQPHKCDCCGNIADHSGRDDTTSFVTNNTVAATAASVTAAHLSKDGISSSSSTDDTSMYGHKRKISKSKRMNNGHYHRSFNLQKTTVNGMTSVEECNSVVSADTDETTSLEGVTNIIDITSPHTAIVATAASTNQTQPTQQLSPISPTEQTQHSFEYYSQRYLLPNDEHYNTDFSQKYAHNYVVYVMKRVSAVDWLKVWYYYTDDTDVADLARIIYDKYFSAPFQF